MVYTKPERRSNMLQFYCCLIKAAPGPVLVWSPLNAFSHVRMAQNVLQVRITGHYTRSLTVNCP